MAGGPRRSVALRYMSGFHCLAGECPDNCCAGGWRVGVDQGQYARLKRAMGKDAAGRERFTRALRLVDKEGRDARRFAEIDTAGRGCALLDDDRRCTVHARFGEALLPDVCATYPRHVAWIGETAELAGLWSCPEVVRRALGTDDAFALVEADAALLGRGAVAQAIGPGDPALARVERVRRGLEAILEARELPLRSRLFAAAVLGHRAEEVGDDEAALFDELGDAAVLRQLDAALAEDRRDAAPAFALVLRMLDWRDDGGRLPALKRVVEAALAGYGAAERPAPAELWARYQARRDALEARDGARLDAWLTAYARQLCHTQLVTASPSLRVHVQQVLLRVALLRVLLAGQPGVDGDAAAREAAAIEVFYAFSRAVEHSEGFKADLTRALRDRLTALGQSVELILI
jgi:lysine-N-methylase